MIWWWERKLWTVITIKKRAWGTGKAEKSGNVNNILETNKESEDEDSYSNLKSLIQKLDKDEEIEGGGGYIKIKQILQIKFGKTRMLLKNWKPK